MRPGPGLLLAAILILLLLVPRTAAAYIGPGAGFAFLSSSFIFAGTVAVFLFYLISLPLRLLVKALRRGRSGGRGRFKRVVILGLDGMDPALARQFMDQGKLPHFQRLRDQGVFRPLATSRPAMSPVAWSSFMTGADPSFHNIFDFLSRDPHTYAPRLSSAEIRPAARVWRIGAYRIPLGRARLRLLRKSRPFWAILGEQGIFSSVIRVPITFPPEPFSGVLLSGMCVPDLVGSQGTFSFYSSDPQAAGSRAGGETHIVSLKEDTVLTRLYGPRNTLVREGERLSIPLKLVLQRASESARVLVGGRSLPIGLRRFSPWIRLSFRPGLGIRIHGLCRFYLKQLTPHLELYVSAVHIDPEKPALPVAHPPSFSVYLAKLLGSFATLGLAEDTWALNEGILDEDAFLRQAYLFYEERERIFFEVLRKTKQGLCICVFDTTDRLQHMFFRFLDESHPANRGRELHRHRTVIEEAYRRMDALLGRLLEEVGSDTLVLVISDHGFAPFKRGVNLNTWLYENGYLSFKNGARGEWFEGVDWSRTRAYSLGLAGIYLNRKGREAEGIVEQGDEAAALKKELSEKLAGLRDERHGVQAITEVIDSERAFAGPYRDNAPDLLVSYNRGYRSSWDCAVGKVSASVIEDNRKRWSGDHCIDPSLVPGVLFCNQALQGERPDIKDVAPTVLAAFGLQQPQYMRGRSLLREGDREQ